MFVPTFYDNIGILVNNSLDFLVVICLDSFFLNQGKLCPIPFKLSHTSIPLHMYMKRIVFPAVEKERETLKSKYFRHIIPYFIIYHRKDRYYFRYPIVFSQLFSKNDAKSAFSDVKRQVFLTSGIHLLCKFVVPVLVLEPFERDCRRTRPCLRPHLLPSLSSWHLCQIYSFARCEIKRKS